LSQVKGLVEEIPVLGNLIKGGKKAKEIAQAHAPTILGGIEGLTQELFDKEFEKERGKFEELFDGLTEMQLKAEALELQLSASYQATSGVKEVMAAIGFMGLDKPNQDDYWAFGNAIADQNYHRAVLQRNIQIQTDRQFGKTFGGSAFNFLAPKR